ncbi:hypothetical protein GCK72_019113 [Caenorhabditis remanei]|uniref:Piwi domain-containing protein n=1 Tax=Caenorhabditis remanei TaxID=31234 RepID=A0A6A5GBS2_CAERE|nr:hypothetical protein GCK72_019113 [Caenorhabditis remanei]KAF1752558.1 hypothetical protein GCK72_019113 [Caenorhabditis remanei]
MSYNRGGGGNFNDDRQSQHSGGRSQHGGSQHGGSQHGGSQHGGSQHGDRRDDYHDQRGGGDYRHGGGSRQGGGYHQGDNLSRQMGQMNMGRDDNRGRGGHGGNRYSEQGPPRPRFERSTAGVANPGDLAGSAHYPRQPVAKKDMMHTKQEFYERPAGKSVFEGKVGKKTELWTNHALVHLPTEKYLIHEYNIEVFNNKKVLNKKEEVSPIFHEIRNSPEGRKQWPRSSDFIFNDVNLLWTIDQLPYAQGEIRDKRKSILYKYTRSFEFGEGITQGDSQLLSTLIDAIATARCRYPKTCRNKYTVYKRSMFMILDHKPPELESFDNAPLFMQVRNGMDARMGLSIGIRLNLRAGITACYDLSHTLFTRPSYPLVRLFVDLIANATVSDEEFETSYDSSLKNSRVTEENKKNMMKVLHKMKLCYSLDNVNPPQKRDFKFYDLTTPADRLSFTNEKGVSMTVAEYYLNEKNIRLRYPNLPCVQKKPSKANQNRLIAFPMELVSLLAEPKRYEGATTTEMKADMVRWTTFTAKQRRLVLQHVISQNRIGDVPPVVDNSDVHMKRHGVTIDKEMLSVNATILPAPTVVYGENVKFYDEHSVGDWKAIDHIPIRKVLEDSVYLRNKDPSAPKLKKRLLGSILKIGAPASNAPMDFDDTCYHNLMKALEAAGQPVVWENEDMGQAAIQGVIEFNQSRDQPAVIYNYFVDLMTNIDEKYKKEDEIIIPICFVLFERRFTTLVNTTNHIRNDYNLMKYLADIHLGIFTQGMLHDTFQNIGSTPSTCKFTRLLVEKILGKVGTTHRKLEREGDHKSWTKVTEPKEPTLFLGVDVSHPSPRDRDDPDAGVRKMSVASVVGNIDLDCNEYRASSKIQSVGLERIVMLQNEVRNRITDFTIHNGIRPAHIVVYRDGLSEGDFQRTLYEERIAIENACISIDAAFQPTITYIVVTKRHHTRFFLKDELDGIEEQGFNIRPGTLVEDTVTTKNYYDFFLATQVGEMGLVRPTHYYVLWNTWKCLPTFWPTVTHALTYTFCRSTTTVALPAPVLYAHLAAKRAKETLDGALVTFGMRDNKEFDMDVYQDVAILNENINNHQRLDGMVFV